MALEVIEDRSGLYGVVWSLMGQKRGSKWNGKWEIR